MIILTRKQLRLEMTLLENLISRYGGDMNLWGAHDNVAVALDSFRGVGTKPKRKTDDKKEYLAWMA